MKNIKLYTAGENGFAVKLRQVGGSAPVFIIAEAGVNHNGDLDRAKRMIDVAAECGVDAVKFQSFRTGDMILANVEKAPYQQNATGADQSQAQMLEKLEISREFHYELMSYCKAKKVVFLSTPYDDGSLDLLMALDVGAIKVSSTDANNFLFLKKIAKSGLPVIFSTGMCSMEEIESAVTVLKSNGCTSIGMLKCTTDYPADANTVNLAGIGVLKSSFPDLVIGFSDHTPGVDVSVYSVFCGAKIIEKHFTLDKTLPGPDHRASLDPGELAFWVNDIRRAEKILGSGVVQPADCELKARSTLRRSLVAVHNLDAGHTLCEDDITAKRAGGKGIGAENVFDVIGLKTSKKIFSGQLISQDCLEL